MKKNIKYQVKAKPFLKWAGGKGQLTETFVNFYPEELVNNKIKSYYEPFVGGGAVFFDIVQRYKIDSAFLFDNNEELVLSYKVVQKDVEGLIEQLFEIKNHYQSLDTQQKKDFYYSVRDNFNTGKSQFNFTRYSKVWIERAAQIIFLNRTCFNGLFRFNLKGEFNVPMGSYKNPKILDENNIRMVSDILQFAKIEHADFRKIEKQIQGNSFVYFDPPYRPISKTSNFTSYSQNRFDDGRQIELSKMFRRLDKKGIKLMLSNSDPRNTNKDDDFFDSLYKDFSIRRVFAKRNINSDGKQRQPVSEIIVTNYPIIE